MATKKPRQRRNQRIKKRWLHEPRRVKYVARI